MTNFFLEGPRFSGKSSLLFSQLATFEDFAGFYVERWLDEQGQVTAFELKDAADLAKPIPPIPEHRFIIKEPKPIWRTEVFEDFGSRLLEQAATSKKLILLDEIGGIELLAPNFSTQLVNLFYGSHKILGVFKSEKNYQEQRQRMAAPLVLDQKRAELKAAILNQGEIYYYDQETAASVKAQLLEFLSY
ncbi:nucleoside-triphosphatase [Enterococcus sp. LJL90]